MPRILLIEDAPNISDFVKRGLEHHGYDVKVAANGCAGLEAATGCHFDLVVLDLMLPDVDGIEVCRQLRTEHPATGIIILTARDLVGNRVQGLEAGADDYLSKPFAFEELLARIRSVLRRSGIQDGSIQVGDLRINVERRQVWRGEREVDITTREFELLTLLAQNAGKPVRRETIIQRVWGYEFPGETDPVKVYVNYLRRKLNAEGEPDMIHTVRGFGYALK
jgi:DNA-binding response OmpR family regulator